MKIKRIDRKMEALCWNDGKKQYTKEKMKNRFRIGVLNPRTVPFFVKKRDIADLIYKAVLVTEK